MAEAPPTIAWAPTYDASAQSDDAFGIAVDLSGSVYVTGRTRSSSEDPRTLKYRPNGSLELNLPFDIGAGWEGGRSVAVDAQGNIIVAGYGYVGSGSDDFRTIKYDQSGNMLWTRSFDGLGTGIGGDEAYGVAVDSSGSIYVAGTTWSAVNNDDIRLVKYSPLGVFLWTVSYDGGGDDAGRGVALDASGSIYIGGTSGSNTVLVKYSLSGVELWHVGYDSGLVDEGHGVVVDTSGSIYVAGYGSSALRRNFLVSKYSHGGVELWSKSYDSGSDSVANSIAVDAQGFLYVTGKSGSDIRTLKLTSEGATRWNAVYDGGGTDEGEGVATSVGGDVFVCGTSSNDYRVIRYAPAVAGLSAKLTLNPNQAAVGSWVQASLAVGNNGGVSASLAAVTLYIGSAPYASVISGPVPPPPLVLNPDESVLISWTISVSAPFPLGFTATVTGVDLRYGGSLSASSGAVLNAPADSSGQAAVLPQPTLPAPFNLLIAPNVVRSIASLPVAVRASAPIGTIVGFSILNEADREVLRGELVVGSAGYGEMLLDESKLRRAGMGPGVYRVVGRSGGVRNRVGFIIAPGVWR